MKEALENATDEDRQRVNEMLDDLNDLLDKHARGEDSQQDFDDFMDKHGEFFPENPRNIDELLDSLAQRAAAAQRFRNSLSAEQRAELDALAQQAFGSPSLMNALNRLDAHLQAARPGEDWDGSQRFSGDDPLGMGEGTQALADIAELEQLAEQLSQSYAGATMDDVDLDMLARQLGDEAAVDARTLAELERALMNQGFLDRGSDGQWRLSPEGDATAGSGRVARCGATAFGPPRERDTRRAGAAGELTGATRAWAVRRHRAVERHPHAHQRGAAASRYGRGGAAGHSHHRRRRRGIRDRDADPGGGRAAGGHVVLDGDGEPVAADEAHRVGAQPSGEHAVPLGCVADHRVRPLRADGDGRRADRAGGRLRAGHQPAPRAARWPAGICAGTPTRSPWCWSSPTASRPRTSRTSATAKARRCSSTTRRTRARSRQTVEGFDEMARLGAQVTIFRLGNDPGPGQVHRPGGAPGRGTGGGARPRRARRRGRRRLSAFAPATSLESFLDDSTPPHATRSCMRGWYAVGTHAKDLADDVEANGAPVPPADDGCTSGSVADALHTAPRAMAGCTGGVGSGVIDDGGYVDRGCGQADQPAAIEAAPDAGTIIACRNISGCLSQAVNGPGGVSVPQRSTVVQQSQ